MKRFRDPHDGEVAHDARHGVEDAEEEAPDAHELNDWRGTTNVVGGAVVGVLSFACSGERAKGC